MSAVVSGLLAGAAGTLALNGLTYLDMAVRGRPASDVPAKTAEKLASVTGFGLATEGDRDLRQNRTEGLGALLGYGAGLGVAMLYAVTGSRLRRLPMPWQATILTVAAMAPGNLPAMLTGATDPREWGVEGWLADVIPHSAYGLVTAAALEWISIPR